MPPGIITKHVARDCVLFVADRQILAQGDLDMDTWLFFIDSLPCTQPPAPW